MSRNWRKEQSGAIWSETGESVAALRKRSTVASNPTLSEGPAGRSAVTFDGTDDKAAYPNDYQGVQSWEGWVYLSTTTEQIIDFDGGTHYIDATAGTLAANGFTAPTIYVDGAVTSTIAAAGWHHVAVTTGTAFDATNLQLATDNTDFGAVRLADMSAWDRALTADEISAVYNRTVFDYDLSLVSRWDMSDPNPQDVGHPGNGNNGTGTGLDSTNIVPGPYGGKAISLNGSNESIDCGAGSSLGFVSGVMSISVLLYIDSYGASDMAIVSKGQSGDAGSYITSITSDGKLSLITIQTGATQRKDTIISSFPIGRWNHVVFSLDVPSSGIFINGLEASYSSSPTHIAPGVPTISPSFKIGIYAGGFRLNGIVSDVAAYSSALLGIQAADLNARLKAGTL